MRYEILLDMWIQLTTARCKDVRCIPKKKKIAVIISIKPLNKRQGLTFCLQRPVHGLEGSPGAHMLELSGYRRRNVQRGWPFLWLLLLWVFLQQQLVVMWPPLMIPPNVLSPSPVFPVSSMVIVGVGSLSLYCCQSCAAEALFA